MSKRFENIQHAKKAMDPLTIKLMNEKLGFTGPIDKKVTTETNFLPEEKRESLRMPKKKKEEITIKIQTRRNKN